MKCGSGFFNKKIKKAKLVVKMPFKTKKNKTTVVPSKPVKKRPIKYAEDYMLAPPSL